MIKVYTHHRGNPAIESHVFHIPLSLAPSIVKAIKADGRATPGSYWEANALKPLRSGIRRKSETIKLRTGGFSTVELWGMLSAMGFKLRDCGDAE